jgi:high-affinity iron transporter
VFETVLFYQALLTQAAAAQYPSVFSGFVVGTAFLAVLAWLLVRYSVKLPIAKFFFVTTYLLLALAFILMGKAISALQEADLIGITPLPVSFEFDWIGVKSTWQGILAQLSVLGVFLVFLGLARRQRKNANASVAERSGELLDSTVSHSKPE